MNMKQEKSVEKLLRADTELENTELEAFAEKYEPVSDEQKERIINSGLKKLEAQGKSEEEKSTETAADSETVPVIEAEHRRFSWVKSVVPAVACLCIVAGTLIYTGSRLKNNNQEVMSVPEVSESSPAVTAAQVSEEYTTAESVQTTQISAVTPAETAAETVLSAVTEMSSVSVSSKPETQKETSATEQVSEKPQETGKPAVTEKIQENAGNWTLDGTVLTFREGVKCISDDGLSEIKSKVTKVIIPDGAEEISKMTFSDFTALSSVEIPDSVKSIGNYAFMNCTSLKEIELPASLEELHTSMFTGCEIEYLVINSGKMSCSNASSTGGSDKALSFKTVVISEKAGRLEDSFTLPVLNAEKLVLSAEAAESLRTGMLSYAKLGSVNIPEGTSVLQEGAFYRVTVPEIVIPESVKTIGKDILAMSDCQKLVIYNSELELEGNLDITSSEVFSGKTAGLKNSTAEKYAKDHGCEFISLD